MNILEAIQKEDGFVNEKIEIRNGPYGSSIFSKVEIQKDETIMEINQKSIISVDSIIKSDALRKFMGALKMDLNPYDLLAIYLTLSKITGQNAAYISSLQVTFDSPLTWPASDVLELPLEIKFFVMSTLSHLRKVFSALNKQLPEPIEFKLFKWCYLNVITRNFNGGVLASTTPAWLEINSRNQNASLIPGLDMCNHWNPANCQYSLKDDRFLLTAKDKIDPNSEIFISYGNNKGDQELLSTYGQG